MGTRPHIATHQHMAEPTWGGWCMHPHILGCNTNVQERPVFFVLCTHPPMSDWPQLQCTQWAGCEPWALLKPSSQASLVATSPVIIDGRQPAKSTASRVFFSSCCAPSPPSLIGPTTNAPREVTASCWKANDSQFRGGQTEKKNLRATEPAKMQSTPQRNAQNN